MLQTLLQFKNSINWWKSTVRTVRTLFSLKLANSRWIQPAAKKAFLASLFQKSIKEPRRPRMRIEVGKLQVAMVWKKWQKSKSERSITRVPSTRKKYCGNTLLTWSSRTCRAWSTCRWTRCKPPRSGPSCGKALEVSPLKRCRPKSRIVLQSHRWTPRLKTATSWEALVHLRRRKMWRMCFYRHHRAKNQVRSWSRAQHRARNRKRLFLVSDLKTNLSKGPRGLKAGSRTRDIVARFSMLNGSIPSAIKTFTRRSETTSFTIISLTLEI